MLEDILNMLVYSQFSGDSPVGAIRRIAAGEVEKLRVLELAEVTSVYPHAKDDDKDNYQCDLKLRNGGYTLTRAQILTPRPGFAHTPDVGDLVAVSFLGGDINAPVVVGCLYNDEQRPPRNVPGEIVYVSPDKENKEARRLFYKLKDGLTLTVKDEGLTFEIGKKTKVSMIKEGEKDEGISIEAADTTVKIDKDGNVAIVAKGKMDITAKGDAALTSDGSLSLKGKSVSIQSDMTMDLQSGSLDIKGKNVSVKGDMTMDLQASSMSVKGDMTMDLQSVNVNVNASGPMSLKGAVINLN